MSAGQVPRRSRVYAGDPEKLAAPDPKLTPQLLAFVEDRYGLQANSPTDLGGSFNLNVRIGEHVLRMYGPWVGAERVAELQRLRGVLQEKGIPIPDLRPALDGSTWCRFGDCVLEVERYVEGRRMVSPERMRTGMRQLGRLHGLMADIELAVPPPIANHLPQELARDATLDATAAIRAWGPTPEESRLAACAEQLAQSLPVVQLRSQLVHGDFWDNNVLFWGDRVVAVLDFDFAGMRPRIDDLALPLTYALQNGVGLAELRGYVDTYDAGAHVPLTPAERRALPFAMARMALSFLQYLLLPGDAAFMSRARREFNENRGPACEWWLAALHDGRFGEETFQ